MRCCGTCQRIFRLSPRVTLPDYSKELVFHVDASEASEGGFLARPAADAVDKTTCALSRILASVLPRAKITILLL